MTIRIDPKAGARLRFLAKKAGEEAFEPADLEVLFEKAPGEDPEPYERLLDDALLRAQPALHPRGRGRGDLADRAAAARRAGARARLRAPAAGGRRRPKDLTRGICQWYEPWLP